MDNRPQPVPAPGRSAGVKEYIRRAFLYRWNLLLLAGGIGAAVLSPFPDALLPLVAAVEIGYLAMLVGMPKFRNAIDAAVYQEARQAVAGPTGVARPLEDVLARLTTDSRRRFELVRARCLEMRAIASQVRGRGDAGPADDLSTPALDRLLWVFLRLLASQVALEKFLARTDRAGIERQLADARTRLEGQAAADERMARSLRDSVAAHEQRLENYDRARQNADFVRIELDRIEAKIHALTESSVNRQNPDLLTSQIDSVAESMQTTEKAISELQQITGLVDEMQEPPAILEADLGRIQQS